jgi:hypothetical protein
VARIAHLASDVIVSVVPSLATESEFSETLQQLQKDNATSIVAKDQAEVRVAVFTCKTSQCLTPYSSSQSARMRIRSSPSSSPFARADSPA